MLSNNKMQRKVFNEDNLCFDYDAVGLYPSAMTRCYFPTGVPKLLNEELISYYNNKDNLMMISEK